MMIDETEDDDEEYLYKLECLYEWWEQEEPLINYNPDNEEYTVSEWFNDQSKTNQFINKKVIYNKVYD